MNEHTPEPWRLTFSGIQSTKPDWTGYRITGDISVHDASRIVACVNACTGMADPEIEIATLRANFEKAMKPCDISQAQAAEWHTRLVEEERQNTIFKMALDNIIRLDEGKGGIMRKIALAAFEKSR